MLSDVARIVMQDRTLAGPLEGATNVGTCGEPGNGAYVRIWLKILNGRILAAASATHGCPSSQAASAMTAKLVTGRGVEQALRLTGQDVVLVLGGLPEGKGHFADMAVSALRSALEQEE